MNLSITLRTMARALPDRPALASSTDALSYAALEHQVGCIAGTLRDHHGLAPGDRVAIVMENCGAFYPLLYGAWRAGLVAVPVNAKLHARELAWILDNAGARLVVVSPTIASAMGGLAAHTWPETIVTGSPDHARLLAGEPIGDVTPDPSQPAWLFYTSGTTGRPKGAVLTHRNLLFMCHAYMADVDRIGPGDTMLHAAPLSHGSGLYGLAHFARGAHHVVLDGFDPTEVVAAFSRYRNVAMFAAPTMVTRLIDSPALDGADTSGLKTIIYGGAPMYVADLERALTRLGPRFYNLYGQGESPMTISGLAKDLHERGGTDDIGYQARLASVGVARTGVAVRVVDTEGRDVRPGEIGEIITASDCVMVGYWANGDATKAAIRDGWLWTGDMGALDAAGFLTLKDRSKDLIISGGSNIYPREIEEVLAQHPGVAECAVIGRPHADWGEEVVAFVVARSGIAVDAAALDALCLANIARFKRPKSYRFISALPKNNYGKVLKTALRDDRGQDA